MAQTAIATAVRATKMRPWLAWSAVLFVALPLFVTKAADPDPMSAKLSAEHMGEVDAGNYSAGDDLRFTLTGYGDKFLLRYSNSPELFVVYPDRGSLGGRDLKYDSGETLIKVSVWGGLTIYTDIAPDGLPANRTGDPDPLTHQPISAAMLSKALSDESGYLASARKLQIGFSADAVPTDPWGRIMVFDTLINTGMGLVRFSADPAGHDRVVHKIGDVKIIPGSKPIISLRDRTLVVTYVAAQGYAGRASSRAIARALGKLFAIAN